jgi:CheY-like chemotaxis protein
VFANLFNNGAKYTPPGGTIRISAVPDGVGVAVRVRDTGIGLPADAIPKLFKMFSQIERTDDHTAKGLGIGLSLVKGLVEMHDGRAWAESEGPSRGSVFGVWLPLAEPIDASNATTSADDVAQDATGRRVLIVDDNYDAADSMATLIALLGHTAEVAGDGAEAVDAAARLQPHLVLLDLGLPTIDGFEAARRIRELDLPHRPRIVAITGRALDEDRRRSAEAGIDLHLVKPVATDAIIRLLDESRDA